MEHDILYTVGRRIYGAGFYNIFQIVRITGRTLLSENQLIAGKKISNFKFQRELQASYIYINRIRMSVCVCLSVSPLTPPREIDRYR